jgi:hypothetical protein
MSTLFPLSIAVSLSLSLSHSLIPLTRLFVTHDICCSTILFVRRSTQTKRYSCEGKDELGVSRKSLFQILHEIIPVG